ncbi:MAG: protein kinase [Sedimentisphaerales bacterium]|nr:protein kinase [Sedimentisphaerales bacterium]
MAKAAGDNQKDVVKEAVKQFVDASMHGEKPDLDEFVKQYPGLESQIRKGIQELNKINNLFDSLVKADDSDFEDITEQHDLVGKKVGNFEIVNIIGRGGMGVVYLAKDTKLKRSVAVKSIPTALADDSTARMRFKREAELLASLNHPNIAVIHEIIEEDKSGYLVLEHVEGETLTEHIARGPLKLEEALSISKQVAEAISAAHKKGVIHRDLKPANIKITPDGQVKVLDFGLAKTTVTEGGSSEISETQAGHIIGTPAYMSPEQARGKPVDSRTDIWSFGCILYQMLAGQLPFEGETATDTLARIIEREPDWELLPQDTPAKIRTILQCCLKKDPNQRLENISNISAEIKETLSKLDEVALPAATSATSRRKTIIIIVTIIIVLSIAAAWFVRRPNARSTPDQITEWSRDDRALKTTLWSEPVAHWTMDDIRGRTVLDTSGNGHHGTAQNGLPKQVDGPPGYGKAFYFDGQSWKEWIDCGRWNPSEKTGQLTAALWAKWDGPNGKHQALIGKLDWDDATDSSQDMWHISIRLKNNDVYFSRMGNWPDCGGVILPKGEWTHLAASYDGNILVFYVNGKETGRDQFSFGRKTDAPIGFGCVGGTGANSFYGALDDVRIYDHALSSEAICALAKTQSED